MAELSIKIIAPVLTDFFHCMHCEQLFHHSGIGRRMHQDVLDQYPEHVKQEAAHLSELVFDLAHRYGDRIRIWVIDPQSLPGFFHSLRYWVRSYPTFIINGRKAIVGLDRDELDQVLQKYLTEGQAASGADPRSSPADRVTSSK
jgi:hypothetical protein